jgi:hypothetical protein
MCSALMQGRGFKTETPLRSMNDTNVRWADKFAAMSIDKPALKGLRRGNRTQWLKPEIRVRAQHLRLAGL